MNWVLMSNSTTLQIIAVKINVKFKTMIFYLALLIKEFLHDGFYLIEQDRVQRRVHIVPHQFFDMLLDLRSELFVVANQQPQKLPHESVDFNYT
jgi:hypothetical protein